MAMLVLLDIVDILPPIACHGVTQDSMFGLQRMRNSTVNARDSRFILVQALDCSRVIALRPVSVSLCVGFIVKCCVVKSPIPRIPALLYIVRVQNPSQFTMRVPSRIIE